MKRLSIVLAVLLVAAVGVGSWQAISLRNDVARVRSEQANQAAALLTVTKAALQLEVATRAADQTINCLLTAASAGPAIDIVVSGCKRVTASR